MDPSLNSSTTGDPQAIISSTAPQISSLQDEIAKYQSNLGSSPTAASSDTAPSTSDIANQTEEQTLQTQLVALEKQNQTAAWYGSDTSSSPVADQGGNTGVLGQVLGTLQKPLYGVVQGVKDVIGDPTNVPNQEFTDLLAEHGIGGIPGTIAGLTADVMFDPVNWITAGTGAVIPRIASGLIEGGAEGGLEGAARAAAAGATSSSFGTAASFLARHAPVIGGEDSPLYRFLNKKVYQAGQRYKGITGSDPMQYITQPGIMRGTDTSRLGGFAPASGTGLTLGAVAQKIMPSSLYDSMEYSSRDWLKNQEAMDAIDRAKASTVEESAAGGPPSGAALAASEAPSLTAARPSLDILKNVPPGQERDALTDEINSAANDASFIGKNAAKIAAPNITTAATNIIQEQQHADELRTVLAPLAEQYGKTGPTGVGWWDNFLQWGNEQKVNIGGKEIAPIRSFMDMYNSMIMGAFKPAHTFLNPPVTAMNAMSMVPMSSMLGLPLPEQIANYYKSFLGYSGIDTQENLIQDLLGRDTTADAKRADDVMAYMQKNPGAWHSSFGVGPSYYLSHQAVEDAVRSSGQYSAEEVANGTAAKEMEAAREQLRQGDMSGAAKKPGMMASIYQRLGSMLSKPAETQSDYLDSEAQAALRARAVAAQAGGAPIEGDFAKAPARLPAGFTVGDPFVNTETLDRMSGYIDQKAAEGNRPFQVFKNITKGAQSFYEREDQAFRTSTIRTLINDGITDQQLKVISRVVPVANPETQIISSFVKDGQERYRMSVDYALQVAHEAAINYGAMPAAIRMLRSLPLVGAPFASFTYGMAIKTAQAAAYNPSFFNKVAFAMQSVSGHKTPLEKEALQSPYYSWYNNPTMIRLPDALSFFSQYPLYLNLANVLPYYYLTIFQQSNRAYSSVLPNDIVQLLDASPVMKDPIGQALFDNFLLPSILSSNERPISTAGEPIYPIGATTADKAFYMGRGIVDNLTPGIVAPVGSLLPSDLAKYYPGYRTREFSYARPTGSTAYPSENDIGVPGTESSASRTIRNILGYFSLPVEPLNTTYAASDANSNSTP